MMISKTINLLKTMLKTSYDTSSIIDADTKKFSKKSIKAWLIMFACVITIYLSYVVINLMKQIGYPSFFLNAFFLILQFLVMFETILLSMSVVYFSNDIENYLCLPISSTRLMITKFSIMMCIIFCTEIIIVLPSIFIYGVRVLDDIAFYPLAVVVLFSVTVFLSAIVSIAIIPVMRLFRFIKSKFLYQNVVILVMTLMVCMPLMNVNSSSVNNIEDMNEEISYAQNDDEVEALKDLKFITEGISGFNKYFIVTKLGADALTEINYSSIVCVLKILCLDVLALVALFIVGKFTYINDVLWNLSIFNKKKSKTIKLGNRCKQKNRTLSYLMNEFKGILKNSVFFMHYIYNVILILISLSAMTIIIFPALVSAVINAAGEDIFNDVYFGFGEFSLIIGIIQVIFILSSLSLTAFSRYGKNAMFFKYIPMDPKLQFRLKNVPQLIINTIIILTVLGTIHYLIPAIEFVYVILMFVVGMLLNIINCNILLFLDLLRPSLNYDNDISVVKQNDNKLFQYVLTVIICIVIWYLQEVTKELNLNIAILIEIVVFSLVVVVMEIFINKKNDRLFNKIT